MKSSSFFSKLLLGLASLPMRGQMRSKVIHLAGVKILPDATSVFVGRGVVFDSIHPELITIEDHTHITEGCVILTHYLDTTVNTISWRYGCVHIKRGAFIGARTIITKPCTQLLELDL